MNCNDKQLKFSVFIINQISQAVKKPTADVYRYLAESGVLDEYIIGCYDSLHTLGREYLIDDVTGMMHDRGVIIMIVYHGSILKEIATVKGIDNRAAMEKYYKSRLCQQIGNGEYGIEYMGCKYLANDLIENEPELFA